MSSQLYLNRAYQNNLVYQIGGKYYDGLTLTPYEFPEGTSPTDLAPIIPVDRLANLTSQPTTNGLSLQPMIMAISI